MGKGMASRGKWTQEVKNMSKIGRKPFERIEGRCRNKKLEINFREDERLFPRIGHIRKAMPREIHKLCSLFGRETKEQLLEWRRWPKIYELVLKIWSQMGLYFQTDAWKVKKSLTQDLRTALKIVFMVDLGESLEKLANSKKS